MHEAQLEVLSELKSLSGTGISSTGKFRDQKSTKPYEPECPNWA
jgi:hypothetical protein